jgi:DNA topoisomerase-1
MSRLGKYLVCSKDPECKYKRNIPKTIGVKCPNCKDGDIIERFTKTKKIFYGCSSYPKCNFALWDRPTGETCPKCKSLMVKTKWKKIKCSNKECKEEADAPVE